MVGLKTRTLLDWALVITFVLVAVTGILLLFYPHEGKHRGWNTEGTSIETWYIRQEILQIHVWSGIAFVLVCLLHLAVNWTCLINMTKAAIKK